MITPDVTAPVYSYWPNDYGLYNMAGNVSEWVMDVCSLLLLLMQMNLDLSVVMYLLPKLKIVL